MAKLATIPLIGELRSMLGSQLLRADEIAQRDERTLTTRPTPERWSIVEIAEHINLSSGHYFKNLKKIYSDPKSGLVLKESFAPGRFGEMGVKAMLPGVNGAIHWKMRTLGIFEPRAARLKGISALIEMRSILQGMDDLLAIALTRGIEGPRVTSTLGPILRFKAGDAFRFAIAHQERHFLQMERTLAAIEEAQRKRA